MLKVVIEDTDTGEQWIQDGLLDVAVAGNIGTPVGCNVWYFVRHRDPHMLLGPLACCTEAMRSSSIAAMIQSTSKSAIGGHDDAQGEGDYSI